MGTEFIIIMVLASVFGLYMAWGIGANDVANAMGTSVGSGALTLKRAVIFAAILEFCGAFFVGAHVSETVRKGIVDVSIFENDGMSFMLGMLAALLSAGAWLQFASWRGWPVSTTHSIVGAVVGFGIAYGGLAAVHWDKVGTIVLSWVVSPLTSGLISFAIFTMLRRWIFGSTRPLEQAKKIAPFLVFFVFGILTLTLVFKGLKNLDLDWSMGKSLAVAAAVGIVAALVTMALVRRIKPIERAPESDEAAGGDTDPGDEEKAVANGRRQAVDKSLEKARKHLQRAHAGLPVSQQRAMAAVLDDIHRVQLESRQKYDFHTSSEELRRVERLFVYLQILSACFVAFAHGANDVANSIGPMSAVISVAKAEGAAIQAKAPVPLWVLALGGVGIVIGLATWGWRVMETIGRKITHLTPTRGFSAEFGAAVTIVVASKLGLPISTTHTLVGAVLGVGLARGIGALNLGMLRDIAVSWVVTIPAGALLAVSFFYALRLVF